MDLNFQYAEHQQSLMRAMITTCCTLRTQHLESAGSVAKRIHAWQQAEGANAANGWSRLMGAPEFPDISYQRTTV
ncbi:hypothetical protein IP81_00960 [Novosphingobium sp. AAP83]|uniref:hypothetical protein n=1 Tax=Novosphingobium sp. AAP83 TaxID=1523425 RepID=UPI0006B9F68F|nr:hypothetical protein [Novosphingobium sp. AAP83]KPF93754.1 hypothetical protein IP81_00960 [Novosphingobium sp. AAP83]